MSTTLPEDVERAIFELTARAHPKSQAGLFRLAKYVSPWIAAIMYETIIIGTYSSSENTPQPPPTALQQYGHHLRNLLLGTSSYQTETELLLFLRNCPHITNIAIWNTYQFSEESLTLLKQLPLIRLSVHVDSLSPDDTTQTEDRLDQIRVAFESFPHVTHLDLAGGIQLDLTPFLQFLPNLAHLSFYNMDQLRDEDWVKGFTKMFEYAPSLKIIILLREGETFQEQYRVKEEDEGLQKDNRIVSCIMDDFVLDWQRGALGEPDLWEFGLNAIRKRTMQMPLSK